MSKEYYTIIRKYYGLPDYLNTDFIRKILLYIVYKIINNTIYSIVEGV